MIEFRTTLLYILSRLNGQRTVYAAYHILRGKKSSQTIQDIHLFGLKNAYSLLPRLKKETYDQWLQQFINEGLISVDKDSFTIDLKKVDQIEQQLKAFNGFKYHKVDRQWFATLQLLIQTLSNLTYQNKRFIPISDDLIIQRQVKSLLNQGEPILLSEQLKVELESILKNLNELYANVFTMQLTGYTRIGYNRRQVADYVRLNEEDVELMTKATIHMILDEVTSQGNLYPLLKSLIINHNDSSLTDSARRTYELLLRGYNIKKIEKIRRLKESTIQDHIIEIATQIEDFDITSFVEHNDIERIVNVINETDAKRLKTLMEYLNHSVTYFQLRLVLAKYHTYKESVDL